MLDYIKDSLMWIMYRICWRCVADCVQYQARILRHHYHLSKPLLDTICDKCEKVLRLVPREERNEGRDKQLCFQHYDSHLYERSRLLVFPSKKRSTSKGTRSTRKLTPNPTHFRLQWSHSTWAYITLGIFCFALAPWSPLTHTSFPSTI